MILTQIDIYIYKCHTLVLQLGEGIVHANRNIGLTCPAISTIFNLWCNMKVIELQCAHCRKPITKYIGEYNRQVKKNKNRLFFCNTSCSASYNNNLRENKRVPVDKICPHCEKGFVTMSGSNENTFCSNSCASSGSVTKHRRRGAVELGHRNKTHIKSIDMTARGLYSREKHRYVELENWLDERDITHCFEYPLQNSVFDLYLPDLNLLVEFDERYHDAPKQKELDQQKDQVGIDRGLQVCRIKTDQKIFSPDLISCID